MKAILAPIITAVALAACLGIVSALLAKIFGRGDDAPAEAGSTKKIPVIHVPKESAGADFVYEGPKSCLARARFFGSENSACLGYGDCVSACPENAVSLRGGVPHINTAACTGCGKCAAACPAGLIKTEGDN